MVYSVTLLSWPISRIFIFWFTTVRLRMVFMTSAYATFFAYVVTYTPFTRWI